MLHGTSNMHAELPGVQVTVGKVGLCIGAKGRREVGLAVNWSERLIEFESISAFVIKEQQYYIRALLA